MSSVILSARDLCKRYGNLQVLKNVSLQIHRGEFVAITGASGAGKSTLLHLLGSLDIPDQGTISLEGKELNKLKPAELAALRNAEIGFIFQFHNLLAEFNALENVCIPAFIGGVSKAKAEQKAAELMNMLGLAHRLKHKPAEMSGGEQQRTAVARALINEPKLILADEPSGNLDTENARLLHQLFIQLKNQGYTIVVVTHNPELAQMADRNLVMKDGEIIEEINKAQHA